MSHFHKAIKAVLAHEGGYVNNPADPGGETKFGISKRSYPSLDIKTLTEEQAVAIYHRDFWRPVYDRIADPAIAAKVFDMAVNMGHTAAHRIVQIAAGAFVDGDFGTRTLAAVNAADPATLLAGIKEEQAHHYRWLADKNPRLARFLKGWLARAAWPANDRWLA